MTFSAMVTQGCGVSECNGGVVDRPQPQRAWRDMHYFMCRHACLVYCLIGKVSLSNWPSLHQLIVATASARKCHDRAKLFALRNVRPQSLAL